MTATASERYTGTVNAQGRVVIPAPVRAALGLREGSRVQFFVEPDGVRVVTAEMAIREVWRNNPAPGEGDGAGLVRQYRDGDRELEYGADASAGADRADATDDPDRAADLLARLGVE